MKKSIYLLFSTFIILTSCSEQVKILFPFTAEGKRHRQLNSKLIREIDSLSNHLFQFSDLKKIDGVEIQDRTLRYEMTYEGFVSANQGCLWDGEIYPGSRSYAKGLPGARVSQSTADPDFTRINYGLRVKGTAYFEKRDSGWVLTGFTLMTK